MIVRIISLHSDFNLYDHFRVYAPRLKLEMAQETLENPNRPFSVCDEIYWQPINANTLTYRMPTWDTYDLFILYILYTISYLNSNPQNQVIQLKLFKPSKSTVDLIVKMWVSCALNSHSIISLYSKSYITYLGIKSVRCTQPKRNSEIHSYSHDFNQKVINIYTEYLVKWKGILNIKEVEMRNDINVKHK